MFVYLRVIEYYNNCLIASEKKENRFYTFWTKPHNKYDNGAAYRCNLVEKIIKKKHAEG